MSFHDEVLVWHGSPLTMAVVIDGSLVGIDVHDNDIVSWLCDYQWRPLSF